jgi:hypothetical protein
MRKLFLFLCLLAFSVASIAQAETAQVDTIKMHGLFYKPAKKETPFSVEFGLATTNLWRGVDVGRQVCVKIETEYEPVEWFTLSNVSTVVSNQYKVGYGNMYNTKASFNYYNVKAGLQDVYFHNNLATPNDTSFFDFNKNTTNHFAEAFFEYKGDETSKVDFLTTYCFYQNASYTKGSWYVEATYRVAENAKLFAGYVVGPSGVSFQNKTGFTNIGINVKRSLQFSKDFNTTANLTIAVNPSYSTIKNDNPTVATRPVNVVLAVIF